MSTHAKLAQAADCVASRAKERVQESGRRYDRVCLARGKAQVGGLAPRAHVVLGALGPLGQGPGCRKACAGWRTGGIGWFGHRVYRVQAKGSIRESARYGSCHA